MTAGHTGGLVDLIDRDHDGIDFIEQLVGSVSGARAVEVVYGQ